MIALVKKDIQISICLADLMVILMEHRKEMTPSLTTLPNGRTKMVMAMATIQMVPIPMRAQAL